MIHITRGIGLALSTPVCSIGVGMKRSRGR
jgi:hypothetical protein